MIGPNGSGKSTLFNVISGFNRAATGTVLFEEEEIARLTPAAIATRGLVRTFQLARPFASLSVLDNVLLAARCPGDSPIRALLLRASHWESGDDLERARELLELLRLWDHWN